LDWIKLYETGFSPLPPGSTKERMVLRNRVPEVAKVRGVRLMEERDVAAVTGLLGLYLQKFDLAPEYSEEEVRHWFLHQGEDQTDRVIWTYVVQVTPATPNPPEYPAVLTRRTPRVRKSPTASPFTPSPPPS
jgi:glycylpeptide N-tetradecanoyltransferase